MPRHGLLYIVLRLSRPFKATESQMLDVRRGASDHS